MKITFYFLLFIMLSACASKTKENKGFKFESAFITQEKLMSIKEAIPLVVIQPKYPQFAAENSIEGVVVFLFDVNRAGYAENIRLIDAKPKGDKKIPWRS